MATVKPVKASVETRAMMPLSWVVVIDFQTPSRLENAFRLSKDRSNLGTGNPRGLRLVPSFPLSAAKLVHIVLSPSHCVSK
jgi:hypothetical protein